MQVKYFIASLLFLLLANVPKDEPMLWNETKKLNWSDFKSTPDPNSDAVALTASGITFGFSVKTTTQNRIVDFNTTVESLFYPHKSWYHKDRANAYILSHEQLHFDITELYARKFRKELTKVKVNKNLRNQLKKLHKDINEALDKTQKRYDLESKHSINPEMQAKWNVFIQAELQKMDNFKS